MSNPIISSKQGVNPSETLRAFARMLDRLADDLEGQHNAQNGQLNAALGNAELGLDNRIDELIARVAEVERQIQELRGADGARSG